METLITENKIIKQKHGGRGTETAINVTCVKRLPSTLYLCIGKSV